LVLVALSLYFSLRQRDGDAALFCIRLGLYLSLLEVVWRVLRAFERLSTMAIIGPWAGLRWIYWPILPFTGLVVPLLLAIVATCCALLPGRVGTLTKNRWRALATAVAVVDVFFLLLILALLLSPW